MKYTLGWIEVARAPRLDTAVTTTNEPDGWERDVACAKDFKLIVNEMRTQTMGRRRRRCVAEFQKKNATGNANQRIVILHTSTRAGFVSKPPLNDREYA